MLERGLKLLLNVSRVVAIFALYSCELNASNLREEEVEIEFESMPAGGARSLKFDELPAEVITLIFQHLPPRDWFNLAGTDRYCRVLVFNELERNETMQQYLFSVVDSLHNKPPSYFPVGWDEVWKARMEAKFLSYAVLNVGLIDHHSGDIFIYMKHLEQFRNLESFRRHTGHIYLDKIHQLLPGLKGALYQVSREHSQEKYSWGPLALLAIPVAVGGALLWFLDKSETEISPEVLKFAAMGGVGASLAGTQLLARKQYEKPEDDL